MSEFKLPASWCKADLGYTTNVIRGITFPASVKEFDSTDQNICCLRTSNIQKEVEWDNIYFVPKSYVKRQEQLINPGDILMSMANSYELVGKVAIVKKMSYPAAFGAFLAAIRPSNHVNNKYLYYILRSETVQNNLRHGSSQTVNLANISIKTLSEVEIPLAPLAEQQEIAALLDNLLAQVDTTKARLDGIPALLKRFRQSVLAEAVSGELTNAVKKNKLNTDKNSNDISYIEQHKTNLLDILSEPLRNGKSVVDGDGSSVLRLTCLKNGSIDLNETKKGAWTRDEASRFFIKDNDYLISRGNGSLRLVGRGGIVSGLTDEIAFPDTMIRIRPNLSRVTTKFLNILWNSDYIRRQIETAAKTTAGIWKISQTDIESIEVIAPSLFEQTEIVYRVETLFAFADQIEARVKTAQAQVNKLTQSILAKAFRGELTADWRGQNPDLISGENSAEALLARIQAERGKTEKPAKVRKKKVKKRLC